MRRCRSRSAIWRLTMTGRLSLRRSAISLASPNREGATTCTRADAVANGGGAAGVMVVSDGMARTGLGRGVRLAGATLGWAGTADSRGMVRTRLMPPLNSSAPPPWSYSGARGSTRLVAAEKPRGARSSRSSYSSYSSSSRPRYTMVFFMNEGDMPSPVPAQRSACSPGGQGATTPPLRSAFGLARRSLTEEGPPDPHHRGARRHSRFEVVAHAHGTLRETQVVGQAGDRLERLPGGLARTGRGHCHQADHVEAE